MSSPLMTPQQRIEALERLEQRQLQSQRTAVRAAWGSVALAVVVLAALIAAGASRVNALNAEKRRVESEIASLEQKRKQAEQSAAEAEKRRLAAVWTLGKVPEAQQMAAVQKQLELKPESAALLPRIYMHIVDPRDKPRAEVVKKALWQAGFIVLGIETIPQARYQKGSDVRFYRESERDQARQIAEVMEKAGEGKVSYFMPRGQDNSRVKQNHFEVWLDHR